MASTQSLNTPLSKSQELDTAEKVTKEFEQPGLLYVRIVEARNLNHVANAKALKESQPMPYLVIEFDKNETMSWGKEPKQEEYASAGTIDFNFNTSFDVSRESDLVVTMYQKKALRGDIPVGTVRISPAFDQKEQDEWFKLLPVGSASTPLTTSVGEIRVHILFKEHPKTAVKPLGVDDFEILRVLGKGSFGKVVQVRKKDTGRVYAMKILKKASIVERDEVQHTLAERNVLAKVSHPFIVNIKFSFQTKDKLYLVLAFVNGGELFHHLQMEGRFEESRARMYAAELLSALECLHSFNIIYRDLKPENILLDYSGHIALCDFGLCKLNMKDGHTTNTFCGTPEYLAPEILLNQPYTKAVDWWTLGVLIYEMIVGLPPFYDENHSVMYERILGDELKFPDYMGTAVMDLLKKLLNRDPAQRLGANGAQELKSHPFFAEINWQKLNARKYRPAFRPEVSHAADTSNFDQEFTSEEARDSCVDPHNRLPDSQQAQFAGFSYRKTSAESMQIGSLNGRRGSLPRGSLALRREGHGLRRWEE
ncbi:Pkinase-domain-containing protein [Rhizoclosmatium globosum]|uniref:non-specific serine/threonine protein kinase n=1 Tax=Rhizoclosmatium globosum TaxID=329046 RepID=A0A1Y2BVL5_9FUNG|nr:Pkinase-domain-containing protein [Rhizoclosmatium globosum]|eukprot:ORY38812.1 Pkinase-domain-containing protein [Rhizoclosmatium globosum]